MVVAPCYDKVNHRDCPDREHCRKVGRSQCTKWVEYEKTHREELEARQKEAKIKSVAYALSHNKARGKR